MQFIVIGRDGKDEGAPARRAAARPAHLALVEEMQARGEAIMGVALLDAAGMMCGSVMVMEFSSRSGLDEWLEKDPYVTSGVWKEIEVVEGRVAPSFQKVLEKMRAA